MGFAGDALTYIPLLGVNHALPRLGPSEEEKC